MKREAGLSVLIVDRPSEKPEGLWQRRKVRFKCSCARVTGSQYAVLCV